jgi:hypothetical protein
MPATFAIAMFSESGGDDEEERECKILSILM